MIKEKRVLQFDIARGICIFLMILDHFAFFSLNLSLQINSYDTYTINFYIILKNILTSEIRNVVRCFVVCILFLISGICSHFSHNNLKRSLKMFTLAMAITFLSELIYIFFNVNFVVNFGVIHFYAVSVFVYYLINKINKENLQIVVIVFLIIMSIIFIIFQPELDTGNWLMFIGVPSKGYQPRFDYFPIFPNIGVFLIGVLIGKSCDIQNIKRLNIRYINALKPIIYIGQNGLKFYALHFPLVLIISFTISKILI